MSASRATFPPVLSRSDGPQLVSMHSDTCAESVKAVEELRPAWESLPAASPMQSFIWAQACAQAFPNAGLRIVSAGEPRPRAIAAFIASPDSAALIPLGAELYEPTEFA